MVLGGAHRLLLGLTLIVLAPDATAIGADSTFDVATGYRIARYRTPVPQSVPGGTRISAPDVEGLLKNDAAVLVDVMASVGAGPDPKSGEWRLIKPHQDIAGSAWLADVGYGRIEPVFEHYFKDNLQRLTNGDKNRAVIIYCQADCWMSWNAVQRAASYGYTKLYWFSEGIDGWRDWGGTLVPAVPVPIHLPQNDE